MEGRVSVNHTIPGWVRVRTPASTANLGPGFDCLGIALKLDNTFVFSASEESGFEMEITGREMTAVPKDKRNLVYTAFKKVFAAAKMPLPALRIKMEINIPLKRGLGSSATAIIGGMVAANLLLPESFPEDVLLDKIIAMEGHPDNVIASYYGGLTATAPSKKGILYRKYRVSQKTANGARDSRL